LPRPGLKCQIRATSIRNDKRAADATGDRMHDIECLVKARFGVGESPVWDHANNRVLWSDNTTDEVHAVELSSGRQRRWHFGGLIGSIGLARSGRWLVAVGNRVVLFNPQSEATDLLAEIVLPPGVAKLNDGKVGPDGAFWVGSMAEPEPNRRPVASLYRVTPDGTVTEKIEGGIRVSNGLAWSPDGRTMFHSDSRGGWIDAWDFDATTGAIANRRRLRRHTPEEGAPDGGATDVEGSYWSAGFSALRFNRIAADGTLLATYPVPAAPTMPCFGGRDMKTMFFTSLTAHVSPEVNANYPLNGSLFMARVDVAGTPVSLFTD
jgi:sugar lactone lactonase YvrE